MDPTAYRNRHWTYRRRPRLLEALAIAERLVPRRKPATGFRLPDCRGLTGRLVEAACRR